MITVPASLVSHGQDHRARAHGRVVDALRRLAIVVGFCPKDAVDEGLRVAPTKVTTPRHVAMSWARRLKRVFGVEIESCTRCGGELKIIASIEEPRLIAKILSHLERAAPEQSQSELPLGARGPPAQPSLL